MIELLAVAVLIFIISLTFSMFGKGGGELYLPVLLLMNLSYYKSAGVSLFLIFVQSLSMIFVYSHKHKLIDWKVAFLLSIIVGVSSFLGGFISVGIPATYLKILFAVFLIASAIMLFLNKSINMHLGKFGVWHREVGKEKYELYFIHLSLTVAAAAFMAGMVGISGGGLIVPAAVLIGGMPLRVAIGTNTFLVLAASSMGFAGHVLQGGVDWIACAVLSIVVIAGSQIGSRIHARVKEKHLRNGLAAILAFAAMVMVVRIFV